MIFLARLQQLLGRVEPRQWTALGASVLLHIGVLLGLRQAPAPLPEPVSFEIALQPPRAETPRRPQAKPLKQARAEKPRRAQVKKPKSRPERKEAHVLDARFKTETRQDKAAPPLELPAVEVAPRVVARAEPAQPAQRKPDVQVVAPVTPNTPATPASATVSNTPQGSESAQMSEPGQTALGSAPAAVGGEPGIVLAQAHALSQAPGSVAGAQSHVGQESQSANAGPGAATLSATGGQGGGLNVAAGRGANAQNSHESRPLPGGEPQGLRLTAAASLSARPEITQGAASLAAGQLALQAGAASPADARGAGQSLASAQAGGTSASPLAGPAAGPGKGGQTTQAERPATRAQGGTNAAGSPARLAAVAGKAASLGSHPAASSRQGAQSVPRSTSSVALAPGEPGSGPDLAISLAPVQAAVPKGGAGRSRNSGTAARESGVTSEAAASTGGADAGQGAGASSAGLAAPGAGMLASARSQTGGVSGQPAGTGAHSTAPVSGRTRAGDAAGVVQGREMSRIQPAEQRIVRADSRADTLDVLAPSTYCPLPIHPPGAAGGTQVLQDADKRGDNLTLPGYAHNNPGFVYPVMANVYGVEGKLVVRVEVQPDGRPGKMLLKQRSGNAILDRDAQEQLARWHFTPARKNGQAVTAWVDVPVIYRLPTERK